MNEVSSRTSSTISAPGLPPALAADRDLRLDLFRGLALWAIFLDHIPSNAVSFITMKNFGFSDAAEIFVFISGYTAAFVYGRTLHQRGYVVASARIVKRAWQVYVAHIFLFVIFMAQVAYVTANFQNPLYTEEMGAFDFMQQPGETLIQALLLKFKPTYMDILPMYVLLMLGLAAVIWLIDRFPNATLAASFGLYFLTWLFQWNLPSYPSGYWFFNPLAWQLLFVTAAWCAIGDRAKLDWILRSNFVLAAATFFLALSFAIAMTWYLPVLAPYMPKRLAEWIYPIDKTNLDILRYLHLLAVALVTVRIIPRTWPGLESRWLQPPVLCGQHSLEIFCLGVFLSFTGHFILVEVSARFWMHIIVSFIGICIMVALAWLMRWYRRAEGKRPGPRPPAPGLAGGEV